MRIVVLAGGLSTELSLIHIFVRAATDQIRETGKKAEVSCVYAVRWFDEHPDDCDILVG